MGWMSSVAAYGVDPKPVQEALYACAMVEAASGKGVNRQVALLERPVEHQNVVYLLTPAAAAYVDRLPWTWVDAEDPTAFAWGVSYSAGVTVEELGLRMPSL